MRRMPQRYSNSTVRHVRDQRAAVRQTLLLACSLVLAVGFLIAAGQHFVAVQCGYRSEELRRERARLLEEQQRLLLTLDETASPAYLERAAREIGLQPTQPTQVSAAMSSDAGTSHPVPALIRPSVGAVLRR